MTPKEKAEELVEKMWVYALPNENGSCQKNAKQCALIAVEEILIEYPSQCSKDSYEMERHLYWQEVKKEIEKL